MSEDLVPLIVRILQEVDPQGEAAAAGELTRDTPLFGTDGSLDSVGLVSLVVAVEQAIEDELGVSVSLADEKALSQRHSPYRTIGSLAEYARRAIQERA